MMRPNLEALGAAFVEECVKVGPSGRRFGTPTILEFAVLERLRPLSLSMDAPSASGMSRGAFRFESNPAAWRASFTLSMPGCGLVACEVSTAHLAWKIKVVIGKPERGTVEGVRGWVIKIPLQAPRVYEHQRAAKQARAYWQVAVHDGRLDRDAWRQLARMAVGQLIRAAEAKGGLLDAG